MKASDFQRPMIWIMNTSIFASFSNIAPPEQIEYVPISSLVKPKLNLSCIDSTVDLNALRTFVFVILKLLPSS